MKETYKGYKVAYQQNDYSDIRDQEGTLATMRCFHNKYNLGDKHTYKSSDFRGWEDMKKHLCKQENIILLKPLYLMDHSGLSISTTPFGCIWDSGQIGYVYITKQKWIELMGDTSPEEHQVEYQLDLEVEEYNHELQGNIWDIEILTESGELVDRFTQVGHLDDALSYAKNIIDTRYEVTV